MAGNLTKNPDGTLIKLADGNLSKDCDCCGPTPCGVCPNGRDGCEDPYTLTVTGVPSGADCCGTTTIAGTYTLNGLFGDVAQWGTSGVAIAPGNPSFAGGFTLTCETVDCNGNPGPPRWVIKIFGEAPIGGLTLWAEAPCTEATPTCPPTGAYTVTCTSCGGTFTLVLS